ncbi:MAG TPA: low molecular weight phosphatase family protein, partial [Ruminococcaceae bacterium]|nr:low molecular weight phosphatase family protein [Oscillospiraceae bacterium]
MKLLFLCTGNTCRSPMAKGIFEKLLKERGVSGIECSSAGLAAGRGQPASKNA